MRRLCVVAWALAAACAPSVRFEDREILWHWADDKPIAMPKIALISGKPMASRDPKVKNRMRIAASSPIASAPPGCCCCEMKITSPLYSI